MWVRKGLQRGNAGWKDYVGMCKECCAGQGGDVEMCEGSHTGQGRHMGCKCGSGRVCRDMQRVLCGLETAFRIAV